MLTLYCNIDTQNTLQVPGFVHLTVIPEKICICVLAFCILQFA